MRNKPQPKTDFTRAEDEGIAAHSLSARDRARLRKNLPAALERVLYNVRLAAETAALEPIGALGHLAHARVAIGAILDPELVRVRRRVGARP